ncbi:MAG: ABC transporter ATP-binding protein [Sedimenticola sp.]|uniref:ATP-binding cassette domain-containing protein n=1 Tax=Sedimenticola thiotaurini TaxID=1543721 RepID=A0A558DG16_9GAMM|nr:ABC transporter ATP-binding protein [Sedimenticola sp.]TVT59974.1 MAG: ATP-binding cassette domain-containing protein [Sedimenticola thiotaurini]MCW8881406.1 ABC transporter ATP-binding protein [Sedimenticola sp.]MCW8921286.1 ABC transporter ATP-binding protein [Sedimenticola sp.]MCW8947915.1 ABC transporter ATP-binding protein [Sedimenticola sp.]
MSGLELKQFEGPGLLPIDLKIEPGECVSLTGVSGSGKTRLLRAIADLDPHQGDALVAGQSMLGMPAPDWRRQVGLLPAESHWWCDQVGEHFTNPASQLLGDLGLDGDCLEWQVSRISSGERQRLALARLLDRQPTVLLLDEPTANLDPENTAHVEQLILRYAKAHGAAVLWVSHDPLQRKRISQRRLQIVDSRIIAEASA